MTERDEKEMKLAIDILTRLRAMPHYESIGYPETMIYAQMTSLSEAQRLAEIKKASDEIHKFMGIAEKTIPVWAYMYVMIDAVLLLYATNIAAATGGEGGEILEIIDGHIAALKEEVAGKKKEGDEQVAYR